jgi:LCP family protein required for cell wall assembly
LTKRRWRILITLILAVILVYSFLLGLMLIIEFWPENQVASPLPPAAEPDASAFIPSDRDEGAPISSSVALTTGQWPSSTALLTPVPIDSRLNILLMGCDKGDLQQKLWRTDTMIVLAVDPQRGMVGALSIPRDLWVDIPGFEADRINTVDALGERAPYPGGGSALVKRTLEENLGIQIDHYVRVDFQGFIQAIDALGGISVDVDCPIEDRFPDPDSPTGFYDMAIMTGTQQMDGELALRFARSRYGKGDFDRSRRQMKVLLAVRDRALQLNALPSLPVLWLDLQSSIQTDLDLPLILSLAQMATEIQPDDIRGSVLDYSLTENWTTPKGYQVLLPRRDQIQEAWYGIFDASPVAQIYQDVDCP